MASGPPPRAIVETSIATPSTIIMTDRHRRVAVPCRSRGPAPALAAAAARPRAGPPSAAARADGLG